MSGTNFITNAADEGVWFAYRANTVGKDGKAVFEESRPDAGRVCVRDIASFLRERIRGRKMEHQIVPNPLSGAMERISYPADMTPEQIDQENGDLWDFAITGLEGFSIGGEAVPCTREGKLKLMAIPAFDRFIGQCLKDIRAADAQAQEMQEKN